MAAVNTNGTYVLDGAVLTIDVAGTPYELECAAESFALEVDNNMRSHPRTGCKAPYEEYIDSSHTAVLTYTHGYGADGIFAVLNALVGTSVSFLLETKDGVVSADFPTFAWDAVVPGVSPLPATSWGEFAAGAEISIPVEAGTLVVATA
ncbi:MAG: hypothetical protein DWP92_01660 [Armatimonadetes bacterium]|nr:MAG: hypothetical protein DWP92_01660 [Armatimonadota bacterium]